MGFLDNTTITVDAILTKKGREKLASTGQLGIVKYAFADDDIDYTLYDTSHPNGSTYYGAVLENMPVLEAFVDETQVMRYKLFTDNKDLSVLSTLEVETPRVLQNNTSAYQIDVTTTGYSGTDSYDFTILNTDVVTMVGPNGEQVTTNQDGRSGVIRAVGYVKVTANVLSGTAPILQTVLFVTSRKTGATASIILQNNTHTTSNF